MQTRILNVGSPRVYAVVLHAGDEAVDCLGRFIREEELTASALTGIGAFSEVVLGYFDWQKKDYRRIEIREQVEVVSLIGDVALRDGKPSLHAHVVVSKADGTAHGGHLLEARVRPTLEVVLTESPAYLRRVHDEETGLALIRMSSSR